MNQESPFDKFRTVRASLFEAQELEIWDYLQALVALTVLLQAVRYLIAGFQKIGMFYLSFPIGTIFKIVLFFFEKKRHPYELAWYGVSLALLMIREHLTLIYPEAVDMISPAKLVILMSIFEILYHIKIGPWLEQKTP